jgi:hypothetical protein
MKPMQTGARLLPVDQNGRVRMPAAQRSAILAEFATSGMTGVAFAAHVGVKYPTFAGWIRQDRAVRGAERQPRRAKQVSQRLRFVEAAPVQAPTVNVLEVELPGGAKLRITASSQVSLAAELLRSLLPC